MSLLEDIKERIDFENIQETLSSYSTFDDLEDPLDFWIERQIKIYKLHHDEINEEELADEIETLLMGVTL